MDGARAVVRITGPPATGVAHRSGLFLSSDDPRGHFGTGSKEALPGGGLRSDGLRKTLGDLPVGLVGERSIVVRQGAGAVSRRR